MAWQINNGTPIREPTGIVVDPLCCCPGEPPPPPPGECCDDLSDTLNITIQELGGDCACADGNNYTLTREGLTNKWRGGGAWCGRDIEFTFCCGLANINCEFGLYLGVTWTPGCPADIGECDDPSAIEAQSDCTCAPLLAEFTVPLTPLCCGEPDAAGAFAATVTEI